METKNTKIEVLCNQFDAGGMNRRNFLRKMTLLGVSALVANAVSISPLGAKKAFCAINVSASKNRRSPVSMTAASGGCAATGGGGLTVGFGAQAERSSMMPTIRICRRPLERH